MPPMPGMLRSSITRSKCVALDRVERLLAVVDQRHGVCPPRSRIRPITSRLVGLSSATSTRSLLPAAAAARVVLQPHHAFAHLVAGRDRVQHVEQLPLVERQLENRGEAGRERLEARHVGVARHREHRGRRRVGRGAAKALRELQVAALDGVEQRAVIRLAPG